MKKSVLVPAPVYTQAGDRMAAGPESFLQDDLPDFLPDSLGVFRTVPGSRRDYSAAAHFVSKTSAGTGREKKNP